MNLIEKKWNEIIDAVRTDYELTDVSVNTWLKPLKIHSLEGNILTIIGPGNEMGLKYVKKKYTPLLQTAIAEETGIDCTINFVLPDQVAKEEETVEAPRPTVTPDRVNLNPKYTFDTFIVGKNNNFAHAASLAVSESPGEIYNPLFIYGGVGLGKTHLMHSIAHFILDETPSAKVLYVTSEYFTNELIKAIRNGNNTAMVEFREKYRNIDVLLIDDIQFIIGKESTQEEFFHTFNELHNNKKQIIISSDKPPKEMETLEARLLSRFEWGLIADIQPPDYETRMAILHKKEEMDGYHIDDKIIEYIATNIKSNIRELEGALTKVVAYGALTKKEITIELAQEALKDMLSRTEQIQITPELITTIVADYFHISPSDIIGKKKSTDIVIPRQIVMYLCRNYTQIPLKEIGKYLGKRDHSTIIHGVEKITSELNSNETIISAVNTLKKKLEAN